MYCYECSRWKCDESSKEEYGEDMGKCAVNMQPTYRLNHGCLLFKKKDTRDSTSTTLTLPQ